MATTTLPRKSTPPLQHHGPSSPGCKSAELAQRSRMILDVAEADLEVAEALLGAFHETTWYFRNALAEARRSWDRLRAVYGGKALAAALAGPPLTVLTIGAGGRDSPVATLIPIAGRTYHVERIAGTSLAPIQWRLTRLSASEDGPYYACRLRDHSTRCDCAEWTYQVAEITDAPPCKHLTALAALGWI